MPSYPKRLIEVDLPIRRISAHSRRDKSIRHVIAYPDLAHLVGAASARRLSRRHLRGTLASPGGRDRTRG